MTAQRNTSDQADMLRQLAGSAKRPQLRDTQRTISVTSGRGGVGSSTVVINLAQSLSMLGRRVLVVDAGPGMGAVSLLLGMRPPCNLGQVLAGEKSLGEIVVDAGYGVKILRCCRGWGCWRPSSTTS
jgi:flagellar biosynthesis protein FlhG